MWRCRSSKNRGGDYQLSRLFNSSSLIGSSIVPWFEIGSHLWADGLEYTLIGRFPDASTLELDDLPSTARARHTRPNMACLSLGAKYDAGLARVMIDQSVT